MLGMRSSLRDPEAGGGRAGNRNRDRRHKRQGHGGERDRHQHGQAVAHKHRDDPEPEGLFHLRRGTSQTGGTGRTFAPTPRFGSDIRPAAPARPSAATAPGIHRADTSSATAAGPENGGSSLLPNPSGPAFRRPSTGTSGRIPPVQDADDWPCGSASSPRSGRTTTTGLDASAQTSILLGGGRAEDELQEAGTSHGAKRRPAGAELCAIRGGSLAIGATTPLDQDTAAPRRTGLWIQGDSDEPGRGRNRRKLPSPNLPGGRLPRQTGRNHFLCNSRRSLARLFRHDSRDSREVQDLHRLHIGESDLHLRLQAHRTEQVDAFPRGGTRDRLEKS